MAAIELSPSSIFSSPPPPSSYLKKFPSLPNSIKLQNSTHSCTISLKSIIYPLNVPSRKQQLHCSTVEVTEPVTVQQEDEKEKPQKNNQRRKLFVLNLPWSFTVPDIKNLFAQYGIVDDVEIIKTKEGKSRGFAFVTMSSGEEAQAAIDKLDAYELSGRIIRVEFAKRFKKPPGTPPPTPAQGETRHKLYVSNLAWKVRSTQLREFFSADYNPVSARVVFDNASGRAAGYGFVSFDTKEQAEAAISALDGKELMGRPIRLKFSERDADGSENKEETPTQENSEEP
ncbi:28 kDa ribonucleoprotein, chloroplastic [Capsicum galapagoense]